MSDPTPTPDTAAPLVPDAAWQAVEDLYTAHRVDLDDFARTAISVAFSAALAARSVAGTAALTEDRAVEIAALEKTLEASRDHARRARREGLDEDTCRFWSGVSGFLRSRIRALQAGEEPDWPDAARFGGGG